MVIRCPFTKIIRVLSVFYSVCALTLVSSVMASSIDRQFEKSSNEFAAELYQKTIEGKAGNVIISPVSIQSAVSLAMFGASGKTKEEMLKGLKYPAGYGDSEVAKHFERFTENVRKTNGLKIANKIYVMKGYNTKQNFKDVAVKSFNSDAQDLDFSNSQDSAKTINDWVEEQTNNKIKDLVSPDSLDSDTRMVLVNAIYFKGFWTYQFDPKATYRAPFYLNDDDSVDVDFMKIKKHFKYGFLEKLDATALELPYKDSDISMLIILPNKKTGLSALESKLNTIDLSEISSSMYSQEVNVEIPKFKIEFDIELNEPLQKMGMERMFSNGAEFGNLLDTEEKMMVSKVVHKAFIEVNEEGAEAAAATVVSIKATMALIGGDETCFMVNRPFLVIIKDSETNIFMGRVNNI